VGEIRALIFDMDGVLIDSNSVHRLTWEQYNRRHGMETTEAMQQRMYGKRNDELIRDFYGGHLTDREVFAHGAAKEALYREVMRPRIRSSLVPGVVEFLDRHRNLPMAVATNAERANLDFVLDEGGLRSYFRVLIDGHQVAKPKPDPEIYLRAAQLLGTDPEFCVVFEDSYAGVRAGVGAGMRVVGVNTTHDDLPGASFSVRDFNDSSLEPWLSAVRPD
jgi:beta-phosphoglucomutase family hydrolase